MPWIWSRVFWWVFAAVVIAILGRATWVAYVVVRADLSLSLVPWPVILLDVMKLHETAGVAAAVGLAIGLLEPIPRLIRVLFRRFRRVEKPVVHYEQTPDAMIKTDRVRTADAWIKKNAKRDFSYVAIDGEEEPSVENVIMARGGRFRYRVMAYRLLTEDERKKLVYDALQHGLLEEPEPGGTATLLTSIGR